MTIAPNSADLGKPLYERFMRCEYHGNWNELPSGTRERWNDAATAIAPTTLMLALDMAPIKAALDAHAARIGKAIAIVDAVISQLKGKEADKARADLSDAVYALELPAPDLIESHQRMTINDGGPELFTPGQFVIDCNDTAKPPIFLSSDPSHQTHLVGWIYEDELPKSYPYDAMFPHSKVDGVRMFPVFAPAKTRVDVEAEIASVVQAVNEWDDRTSPDDYPDHLLITSEELSEILRNFADTLKGPNNG